jgi:hypothetical protein
MQNNEINGESSKRILNILLENPGKYFKFVQLRRILADMSDSSIRGSLRELENKRILDVSGQRGKPAGKKGSDKIKYYKISKELNSFKDLSQFYSKNDIQSFLFSKYVRQSIKTYRFTDLYDIQREKLKAIEFRIIASKAFLNHPSVIEEYHEIAEFIYNYYLDPDKSMKNAANEIRPKFTKRYAIWNTIVDSRDDVLDSRMSEYEADVASNFGYSLQPIYSNHIEMLKTFCPLEAVGLYRKTLAPKLVDLYIEMNNKSLITNGLSMFLECDNYISPFTSFPLNSPQSLLWYSHFQRIFEDIYLLEPQDLDLLAIRALAIHDEFPDILFELFRNNLPLKESVLEDQIKHLVFEWNVASTNFDSLWLFLESLYREKGCFIKCHISRSGIDMQIKNLVTDGPDISDEGNEIQFSAMPIVIIKPWVDRGGARYMEDPFNHLRPCACFDHYGGNMEFISIEQIISDLKLRFAEHGFNYNKIK